MIKCNEYLSFIPSSYGVLTIENGVFSPVQSAVSLIAPTRVVCEDVAGAAELLEAMVAALREPKTGRNVQPIFRVGVIGGGPEVAVSWRDGRRGVAPEEDEMTPEKALEEIRRTLQEYDYGY